MAPDSKKHNPNPDYLRDLLEKAGLSQRAAAKIIGVKERTFRNYLADGTECPYPVQFCLENLAELNTNTSN